VPAPSASAAGEREVVVRQQLTKATVEVLAGSARGQMIEVLFNPTEYSIEHSASYQETAPPGLDNPITQFVNGNSQVLAMDLFFDTYTDGGGEDVSERTRQFTDLVRIDGDLHAPPTVRFTWGVLLFQAIIDKISQRFTMFLADGTPVRATLSVTFTQYKTIPEQLQDPRRSSADKTKHRMVEGPADLWLLAAREYGDVAHWRRIARANRIDDPRSIVAGDVLVLPPLDDVTKEVRRGAKGPR
jgi:nucleoid-associated protein YgaU